MVYINNHGRHNHKIGKLPVAAKEQANYNSRYDEMKGYMNDEATPLTIITKTISIFFI